MLELLIFPVATQEQPLIEIFNETKIEETIEPTTHTVSEGESLYEIAEEYDTTISRLFSMNTDIDNPDIIDIGDELIIPEEDEELDIRDLPAPVVQSASTTQSPVKTAVKRSGGSAPVGYYDWGWCTFGAWSITGWAGAWGNAHSWDENARRDGHTVSTAPIVGAIFVDNGGSLGHVGVVTAVSGNQVTVKDMNYSGFGQWTTRTVPASRYIYIYP